MRDHDDGRTMKEQRRYNLAMLAGIIVLLVGIPLHSWLAFAGGALLAGVGGLFGMMASVGRSGREESRREEKDPEGRDE